MADYYGNEGGMPRRASEIREPLLGSMSYASRGTLTPNVAPFKKEKKKPNNTSIFKLTAKELELFFNKENTREPRNRGECRGSLNILAACGYNDGLCDALATDPMKGILGDVPDLERRVLHFGAHKIAPPEI